MSTFRNPMIMVIVDDPTDYTILGVSREESDAINENEWYVVNASRPLTYIWENYEYAVFKGIDTGLRWEKPGVINAWHFAAGPVALVAAWNRDDAYPVKLMTIEHLEDVVTMQMAAQGREDVVEGYKELNPDGWVMELANVVLDYVWDKRRKYPVSNEETFCGWLHELEAVFVVVNSNPLASCLTIQFLIAEGAPTIWENVSAGATTIAEAAWGVDESEVERLAWVLDEYREQLTTVA